MSCSASSAAFCINGSNCSAKMRNAYSWLIFALRFFISGAIGRFKMDGLAAVAVSWSVIAFNRRSSMSHSKVSSRHSSGFCTASPLSSVWPKVVWYDGLALFRMMCLESHVIAVSSESDTSDFVLRLFWLSDTFSTLLSIGLEEFTMVARLACWGSYCRS